MKSTLTIAVLLSLATACGGDSSTSTDGGNDSSSNNDSTSNNDGNTSNDGGSESSTPSKAYTGTVTLSQTAAGNVDVRSAIAGFEDTPDGGTSATACLGVQSGSCCYVAPGTDAGAAPPTPTTVSAGVITLKDGTTSFATMTPNGTTYALISNPPTTTLTWNAGDTLAISGAGDTVHAFSGSLNAVAAFEGVTPTLSQITATTINRSADFTITWTAKTGTIGIALGATKGLGATFDGSITCSATSDSGTITVPKALLGNFTAGDNGTISLVRSISADASPDNATISLESLTTTSGKASYN